MKKTISLLFLNYLRILAKIQLAKISFVQKLKGRQLTVVGITGSAGKSSTLLAAEAALSPDFRVKTNSGGNSESGIPLCILDIKTKGFSPKDWLIIAVLAPLRLIANWKSYDVFLVEMGIDEPDPPKNMAYLLKIIKPSVGIFLNVGAVHSMQFDKTVSESIKGDQRLKKVLENIGLEKARLINQLRPSGTAIINLDDPVVSQTTRITAAKKLTIGHSGDSTFKIIKTKTGANGFFLAFSYQQTRFQLNLPGFVLPEIFSVSLASALLAAVSLNLSMEKAVSNLSRNLTLPHGRSELLSGRHGLRIIDSSYNSSPQACLEMLSLLKNFPSPRIAILGDMRELGRQSESAHRSIYQKALSVADLIIGVGPESQKYFAKNNTTHTFQYWWQALEFLESTIKSDMKKWQNASLLVKGSQNTIFLEELIKALLENPADSKRLCRQSPYWLAVKENFRKSAKS